ncbi:MAG: right-handed parallel beta-helix repeat-containing protein [Cyanobacteria bacterium J06626_18]
MFARWRKSRRFRHTYQRWILLLVLMMATMFGVACVGSQPTRSSPTEVPSEPELTQTDTVPPTSEAAIDCSSESAGPTDNPVAAFYGDEVPAWVDELPWQCVFNIQDYAGASDQEQFEAAQAAAIAAGGGTVYFPEGTYQFEEDLVLGSDVVVRGEAGPVLEAKDEAFQPLTRLEFPKYEPRFDNEGTPNETAFKQIRSQSPDTDSNQGLVFLDIDRGAIALSGDPDSGTMARRLIFGIRSNNVAEPDPEVPNPDFQPLWTRFSSRFAANLRLTVQADALIANNRINDAITDAYEQPGYVVQSSESRDSLVTYAEGDRVPFSYTDHYCIVVNRSKPGGFEYARSAEDEPGLFREGIVIRDNWVFKTMRVGIHASGQGLEIRDNEVHDQPEKAAWTNPKGQRQPRGSMTFESRAIDWSGHSVSVVGNTYEVYRHRIMDSKYFSTDGEGILAQQCCGGTSIEGVTIRDNQGQGYIGIYKIPDVSQVVISENDIQLPGTGFPAIYVNADTNNAPSTMSEVTIADNVLKGGILAQASSGGSDNRVVNNRGEGSLEYSCHVQIEGNEGFDEEPCE